MTLTTSISSKNKRDFLKKTLKTISNRKVESELVQDRNPDTSRDSSQSEQN